MGIFGAFFGAIGGALSAIGGTLSSALGALGGPLLSIVGGLISTVLGALVDDKEDPEDLGERVLQAEERGIGKESEESFLDARKRFDDMEIDPEKKHDPEEAKKVGLMYQIQCAKEKNVDITDYVIGLAKLGEQGLLNEENKSFFENLKGSANELNDMGKMFSGKLDSNEAISQCLDKLAESIKSANPNMSENDAYGEALKYRT